MPLCYRSMPWLSGLKGSDATHGAFYGILRQLGDGVREFGCDAESAQAELAQLSSQSAPTEAGHDRSFNWKMSIIFSML